MKKIKNFVLLQQNYKQLKIIKLWLTKFQKIV